ARFIGTSQRAPSPHRALIVITDIGDLVAGRIGMAAYILRTAARRRRSRSRCRSGRWRGCRSWCGTASAIRNPRLTTTCRTVVGRRVVPLRPIGSGVVHAVVADLRAAVIGSACIPRRITGRGGGQHLVTGRRGIGAAASGKHGQRKACDQAMDDGPFHIVSSIVELPFFSTANLLTATLVVKASKLQMQTCFQQAEWPAIGGPFQNTQLFNLPADCHCDVGRCCGMQRGTETTYVVIRKAVCQIVHAMVMPELGVVVARCRLVV